MSHSAALALPWDKLLGPIFALLGVFIAAQARRGANALGKMKDNLGEVPKLITEVTALRTEVQLAHKEAKDVGDKFTAFAEESSEDRKALHANLHEVRNGMQMTAAVAGAVSGVGDGLGRIAEHLERAMRPPPLVPDGPPRREIDRPGDDWRDRRRREPFGELEEPLEG